MKSVFPNTDSDKYWGTKNNHYFLLFNQVNLEKIYLHDDFLAVHLYTH
ncbi:hypothetical protein RV12_GL002442 [Enterococcus quebecensis]|nr:hypothetical protein RV12_GL002442 [Enterococcus quebecensis]